jgi:hypothetical protein
MIYLYLKGGLGNMLFQIAAAQSMGIDRQLPVSFPNVDQQLQFCDDDMHHNPSLKHSFEYKQLRMYRNVCTQAPPANLNVFEYPFEYTPKQPVGTDFVINGFFQSEKYFAKNATSILSAFSPTEEMASLISHKYPWLQKETCTSIHVRRGDYVKLSMYHSVLSNQYYDRAIKLARSKTHKFVVFSDDIDWCKSYFVGDEFLFVENEKDYVELYMMAACKNNVTSNSSFAWWGAWLNPNPDKFVIAPVEKWFGPGLQCHNTNDIIPASWHKV